MKTSKKFIASAAILLAGVGIAAPVGIATADAASTAVSLKVGQRGQAVTALQHLLNARGHRVAVDGSYGDQTKAAVRAFQSRNGLTVDGVAGPRTQAKLVAVVKYGSGGSTVKAAQTLLNAAGANIGTDGAFGPRTKAAVLAFQKARGLTQDGVVGPQTWAALFGTKVEGPVTPPPPPEKPHTGDITRADLEKMFPGKVKATSRVQEGLPALNAEMRKRGITTPARKAAFLATLANESGFDYAIGEVGYDPYSYRGRGYIQLTTRGNYQAAGSYLGIDLLGANQVRASRLPYSAQIAGWYWVGARPKSNEAADRFDMGAISAYVGYRASRSEDAERCADFKRAYQQMSGKAAPASTRCYRHY